MRRLVVAEEAAQLRGCGARWRKILNWPPNSASPEGVVMVWRAEDPRGTDRENPAGIVPYTVYMALILARTTQELSRTSSGAFQP